MRSSDKPATFEELMGKSKGAESEMGKQFSMEDLKELLGPRMPDLPYNSVGRVRLVQALQERFGQNWRQLPSLKSLISDFDKETQTKKIISKVRG